MTYTKVHLWDIFEHNFKATTSGNPFVDTTLEVVFEHKEKRVKVNGFYDGDDSYKVRFMPDLEGQWQYTTTSNIEGLHGLIGTFECIEPCQKVHGMVKVHDQYHFAYADGTAYVPFGTTCYAWIHQEECLQEQTLETLKASCFNKLRMCVFPKYYANNSVEPERYPFEGIAPSKWDYTRFNPEFFKHLERCIHELMKLGIEVDLILFHPYDKGHWGFDRMDRASDERYLRYIIARLGAFRNIWWSLANEYDYMEMKTKEDWENHIALVANEDPYHHLVSIHQGDVLYDHWNPHLTHASIQLGTRKGIVKNGMGRLKLLRDAYHKPVIYDEVGYEGNLVQRWGQLTGQELVDKFWQAIVSGTYTSHGETFTHPEEIIWWAKGGTLRGKSPKRIAFLKQIIEESGLDYLEPVDKNWAIDTVGKNGEFYLIYFSYEKPSQWQFALPTFKTGVEIPIGAKFQVDVIDTWNMTITPVEELYEVTDLERYACTCNFNPIVELPEKPFMALRIKRVE